MSIFGTATRTVTATYTQARRLASRIAAELRQIQRFYDGKPTDAQIDEFAEEAELLLNAGYLGSIRYGFKRNGEVIFELMYTAEQARAFDDKPGRVPVGKDVSGGSWFSFLERSRAWHQLSQTERDAFNKRLPISRAPGTAPGYAAGVNRSGSKHFSEETLGLSREVRSL